MNSMREIWSQRFFHYVNELQKYMRYVFTGHLAIVFVFAIGAGGYAYSEWLKEVPVNFPAVLLTAFVISTFLAYSAPTTLLKRADIVYFLPLEHQFPQYFKRALTWSAFSQLPAPLAFLVIALPLLKATETASTAAYLLSALLIIALKVLFTGIESSVRIADARFVWGDRIIRFVFAFGALYVSLQWTIAAVPLAILTALLYAKYWEKRADKLPFPYEHFIELEQNRMMRFYRFANYFTDVPHLAGTVSKRNYLAFAMRRATFRRGDVQAFLVSRTFIRTDDTFRLWIRLTALAALGAFLIPMPVVLFIYVGALAFATAIQLVLALEGGAEFTMDELFPEDGDGGKTRAVRKLVRKLIILQAAVLFLAALLQFNEAATPFFVALAAAVIGEITIRLTKEQERTV